MKTKDRVMGVKSYQTVTKARLVKEPTEILRFAVTTSKQAYEFAADLYDDDIEVLESFYCIYLNRANKIISYSHISHGGVAGTLVDPKIIFKIAIDLLCSGIILVHNHPSGNHTASEADKSLTREIQQVARFHKISILDHLIISPHGYFSFADMGLL